MISDKELYADFLKGDIGAFETLVLRHRQDLVYFIQQYTHCCYQAEDIAQDVFAYLYVNPTKYNMDFSFKTFLFTIGKRRAVDFIRRQSSQSHISLEEADPQDQKSLEDLVFSKHNALLIKDTLLRLPENYRRALVLTKLQGFSVKESAKILGHTEVSVRVLVHRACKSLEQIMKEEGFCIEDRS